MSSVETEGLVRLDLDDPEAGIMAYSVGGKVTGEQAQSLFGRIEAAAGEGRKLRLYYEMHGFPSAEPSVFLEKLKHMKTIMTTVERLAIVGDQRWLGAYTAIFDPITKMDMRNFSVDQKDEATAWLRE